MSQKSTHIQTIMEYSMKCFNEDEILINKESMDYGRTAKGTKTKDGVLAKSDSSGDIGLFCRNLYQTLKQIHGDDRITFQGCTTIETLNTSKNTSFGDDAAKHENGNDGNSTIVSVKTTNPQGETSQIHGDMFIVAMGTGSTDICTQLGVQCPIYPVKGYLVTFSSNMNIPYNYELTGKAFVAPKGNGQYRLSGIADFHHSSESLKMTDKNDSGLDRDSEKRVDDLISLALPKFPDLNVIDYDYCYRPVTPDDLPMIGKSSKYENLFLCTGHGSKGWTMGPGSGKLLADIMTQNPLEIDPEPYAPSRFDYFKEKKHRI